MRKHNSEMRKAGKTLDTCLLHTTGNVPTQNFALIKEEQIVRFRH